MYSYFRAMGAGLFVWSAATPALGMDVSAHTLWVQSLAHIRTFKAYEAAFVSKDDATYHAAEAFLKTPDQVPSSPITKYYLSQVQKLTFLTTSELEKAFQTEVADPGFQKLLLHHLRARLLNALHTFGLSAKDLRPYYLKTDPEGKQDLDVVDSLPAETIYELFSVLKDHLIRLDDLNYLALLRYIFVHHQGRITADAIRDAAKHVPLQGIEPTVDRETYIADLLEGDQDLSPEDLGAKAVLLARAYQNFYSFQDRRLEKEKLLTSPLFNDKEKPLLQKFLGLPAPKAQTAFEKAMAYYLGECQEALSKVPWPWKPESPEWKQYLATLERYRIEGQHLIDKQPHPTSAARNAMLLTFALNQLTPEYRIVTQTALEPETYFYAPWFEAYEKDWISRVHAVFRRYEKRESAEAFISITQEKSYAMAAYAAAYLTLRDVAKQVEKALISSQEIRSVPIEDPFQELQRKLFPTQKPYVIEKERREKPEELITLPSFDMYFQNLVANKVTSWEMIYSRCPYSEATFCTLHAKEMVKSYAQHHQLLSLRKHVLLRFLSEYEISLFDQSLETLAKEKTRVLQESVSQLGHMFVSFMDDSAIAKSEKLALYKPWSTTSPLDLISALKKGAHDAYSNYELMAYAHAFLAKTVEPIVEYRAKKLERDLAMLLSLHPDLRYIAKQKSFVVTRQSNESATAYLERLSASPMLYAIQELAALRNNIEAVVKTLPLVYIAGPVFSWVGRGLVITAATPIAALLHLSRALAVSGKFLQHRITSAFAAGWLTSDSALYVWNDVLHIPDLVITGVDSVTGHWDPAAQKAAHITTGIVANVLPALVFGRGKLGKAFLGSALTPKQRYLRQFATYAGLPTAMMTVSALATLALYVESDPSAKSDWLALGSEMYMRSSLSSMGYMAFNRWGARVNPSQVRLKLLETSGFALGSETKDLVFGIADAYAIFCQNGNALSFALRVTANVVDIADADPVSLPLAVARKLFPKKQETRTIPPFLQAYMDQVEDIIAASKARHGDWTSWYGLMKEEEGEEAEGIVHKKSYPKLASLLLDEVLAQFHQGLVPDLNQAEQRALFQMYTVVKLGSAQQEEETPEKIAQLQKEHPELGKAPLSDVIIAFQKVTYPPTDKLQEILSAIDGLKAYIQSPRASKSKRYWLMHLGKGPEGEKQFSTLFGKTYHDADAAKKCDLVFDHVLAWYQKTEEGSPEKPLLAQLLLNITYTAGFFDTDLLAKLKAKDGMVQLEAFRSLLTKREMFAVHHGFSGGFSDLVQHLRIDTATNLPNPKTLMALDQQIEMELHRSKQTSDVTQRKTIRHLSFAESFLRGCLGGDCSSEEYFLKAGDPNYHYFTTTDAEGNSSGQVTIVLGETKHEKDSVKVAFVDKIQNIPNDDIPPMLEAIRRSIAIRGYTLALPVDLGDHNGISNSDITRSFIENNLPPYTQQTLVYTGFTPHPHNYAETFAELGYSRAYDTLPVRPLLPYTSETLQILLQDPTPEWKTTETIDLQKLYLATIQLKYGDPTDPKKDIENKLRYLRILQKILQPTEVLGQEIDPESDTTLFSWMQDTQTPFRLKKAVMLHYLTTRWLDPNRRVKMLKKSASFLTFEQKSDLIQNWMDTPWIATICRGEFEVKDLAFLYKNNAKVLKNFVGFADSKELLLRRDILEVLLTGEEFVSTDPSVWVILKVASRYGDARMLQEVQKKLQELGPLYTKDRGKIHAITQILQSRLISVETVLGKIEKTEGVRSYDIQYLPSKERWIARPIVDSPTTLILVLKKNPNGSLEEVRYYLYPESTTFHLTPDGNRMIFVSKYGVTRWLLYNRQLGAWEEGKAISLNIITPPQLIDNGKKFVFASPDTIYVAEDETRVVAHTMPPRETILDIAVLPDSNLFGVVYRQWDDRHAIRIFRYDSDQNTLQQTDDYPLKNPNLGFFGAVKSQKIMLLQNRQINTLVTTFELDENGKIKNNQPSDEWVIDGIDVEKKTVWNDEEGWLLAQMYHGNGKKNALTLFQRDTLVDALGFGFGTDAGYPWVPLLPLTGGTILAVMNTKYDLAFLLWLRVTDENKLQIVHQVSFSGKVFSVSSPNGRDILFATEDGTVHAFGELQPFLK